MKTKREVEVVVCDGCQYDMRRDAPKTLLIIPVESQLNPVEFHFHYGEGHDCFRYWALDTYVMKRSLDDRGFDSEEIETFMKHHLYRKQT